MPYLKGRFGNAASRTHSLGDEAAKAVEKARAQVARLIGAEPKEIIFTSGATESNNLALKGVAEAYRDRENRILTVGTEHRSILDSCKRLEITGLKAVYLAVESDGLVDLRKLKKAISPKTILISVMFANNEIGVIQPVADIGRIAKEAGILFHCDAAQALGKVPIDVKKMSVDLLSVTAHKIHGPKGVGALYIRKTSVPQVKLLPMMDGGGHEGGFRSGTLNVPGIVGFGEACELYSKQNRLKTESKRLRELRDRLKNTLLKNIPDCRVNGSLASRLPNNLNVSFEGVNAGELMAKLKGIALSSGSACLSSSTEPSYVLKALGIPEALRRSSVRFGLSRFNTSAEIDETAKRVILAVRMLRRVTLRGFVV